MLDKTIIRGAAKGKKKDEKQLFEHYYPYVMSITLRYMQNEAEAEECLNDSFLKVFKSLKKYDSEQAFRPWLRRITVNTCIDALRKKKKDRLVLDIDQASPVSSDDREPLLDTDTATLPLIRQLPDAYRIVFNLYVFEDLKHREIAKMLGISEGTSKSNYARAKELIRKRLSNDPKELKRILFQEKQM